MKINKISLVMPVYNEEKTLELILAKILNIDWGIALEIVIVNDCSKDKSSEIIAKYATNKQIKVLNNPVNLGKSQSVKVGILASTGDLVGIQDSDLEYEPSDLLKMVKLFQTQPLDVIYGNRFGKSNTIIYYSNWIGNRALSFISNLFTYPRAKMWISDMETCYKVVRGDVMREIATTISSTTNFGFEPEVTAKLAKYKIAKEKGRHLKFTQIPIDYYPRTIAQGKKMKGISDGFKALLEIFRFNLFN